MEQVTARRIIETLRAGVPSRQASRELLAGRDQELGRCATDLDAVAADGQQRYMVVFSTYGGGKSHFLSAVANLALERGFAVSQLVLSRETPFNRIKLVYEAAAHDVELPGYPRSGFEEPLMKIRLDSDMYYDIRERAESDLPRPYYVFRSYLGEGDAPTRSQLYEDLAGSLVPMATLKALYKARFGEALKMPGPFILPTGMFDYFRFLSLLVRKQGYKGWVILLDEAELLARLGVGARAQAYVNLGALLGIHPDQRIDGLYVVCAFADDFEERRLLGGDQSDLRRVPAWLRDPRRNRPEDAQVAEKVLEVLLYEKTHLPAVTHEQAIGLLGRLSELHGMAYKWEARLDESLVVEKTATELNMGRIRTTVRAAIEYLDIAFQYGKPSNLEVGKADEGRLDEDQSFFVSDHSAERS